MKKQHQRGFLVTAGALITSALLALGGATAANAETVLDMPTQSGIIITKLEQGTEAGTPTNGLRNDAVTGTPIEGVTFKAYEVPVTEDPGTNKWQKEIAAVTLQEALDAVDFDEGPVREGVTDDNGQIFWQGDDVTEPTGDLPWGLYLIRETNTPQGVVPSGDFLVAVPLTDPLTLDANGEYEKGLTKWLDDIYVYPKNATVEGTKTVKNATNYVVGDTVTWTINAEIPQVRDHGDGAFVPTDKFEIWDTLTDAQLTLDADTDSVKVIVPAGLDKGTGDFEDDAEADYFVELHPDADEETTTVKIMFTERGRAALVAALPANGDATFATVTLDTVVESVGEIENAAIVHPGGESSYEIKPATVKYGNFTLKKVSTDGSVVDEALNGAEFRVYLSEAYAVAKNPLPYSEENPGGYLTTKENADGLWVTGQDGVNGEVVIGGLRYSDFANGFDHNVDTNDIQRTYWLVEVKSLEDHQLLAEPLPIIISSHDASHVVEVTNTSNGNGFVLPLTGGMGTAFLTIGGIAILSVVLLVARSRRNDEVTAE